MTTQRRSAFYWTPRILGLVLVLGLAAASYSVVESGMTASEMAMALLIYNIPTLALAVVLWIAWRHDIVGGVGFLLAGLAHMIYAATMADSGMWYTTFTTSLFADIPALIIGGLFLEEWARELRSHEEGSPRAVQ